jgi:hypothetical protein
MAGVEAIVVAAAMLGFGYLLADAVFRSRGLDRVALWALAFPAFAGYATALMLAHMGSGGRVLSNAWLTGGLTIAVAAALLARRFLPGLLARRTEGERTPGWGVLVVAGAIVLAGLAIWGSRVFRVLPLDHVGDTPWHMGMASQLLNGETTPSATVTGDIPNSYPWLFHALIALLARFTPGGRAFHALAPLQILQVAGWILALFALGWEIGRRWTTGAAAALIGAVLGSFGARNPGVGRRPYNLAFYNVAPPFPRDIALLLLIAFLVLLVAGLRSKRRDLLVAAGLVLGLAGLAGAESFFVGFAVAVVIAAFPPAMDRRTVAPSLLVPALGLYAVWLVPLAINYVRLGGFVSITLRPPVELTAPAILTSWGIATPLAALGLAWWVGKTRTHPGARTALVLLVVTGGLLLFSALIPEGLGEAFLSLGRRHRYWPLLHLAVVIYAALGASEVLERAARWHIAVAVALAIVLIAPVTRSSVRTALVKARPRTGLLVALEGQPDALLNVISPAPGRRCVIATPLDIDISTFAYTGYRLVLFRWPEYTTNLARIRWKEIYDHIPGDDERLLDNTTITTGLAEPSTWNELVRRYGVDLVVAPERFAGAVPFRGLPARRAAGLSQSYEVISVTPCD